MMRVARAAPGGAPARLAARGASEKSGRVAAVAERDDDGGRDGARARSRRLRRARRARRARRSRALPARPAPPVPALFTPAGAPMPARARAHRALRRRR